MARRRKYDYTESKTILNTLANFVYVIMALYFLYILLFK